jgi:predicted nucleotidyltransferase
MLYNHGMPNVQLFYEDIFRKLQEKDVKYLLIGGIAVNLYGIQRATGDIDLLLQMDKTNLEAFIALVKELGMAPKLPVKAEDLADPQQLKRWHDEKNLKAFSFIHPDNPYIIIDVMVDERLPFAGAYARRQVMRSWGVELSVVSLADLIKLKTMSGRAQDQADIEALSKLK